MLHKPLHRLHRAAGVALIFLLTASLAAAQDWSGRGRLEGQVLDQDRNPIQGATITLLLDGKEGKGPKPFETNKRGKWGYLGLSTGPWTMIIEMSGYQAWEGSYPVSEYERKPPVETILKPAGAVDTNNMDADQQKALAEAQAKASEQQAVVDEANALLDAGNHAGAQAKFQELADGAEGKVKTFALRGVARAQYAAGDIDGHIATLQAALTNEPGNVDVLKALSSVLVDQGRQEEADVYIAQLPQGEKIDPNAFLNQGIAKFNEGDTTAALEIFNKVVADYPDMAEAYYYRGLSNMGAGDNATALADFQKLLELDPDSQQAGEARQFIEYLETQ